MDFNTRCKTCKSEMYLLWEHDYKPQKGLNAINSNKNKVKAKSAKLSKITVGCPYCHSTDTTKISTGDRFFDSIIWGAFGSKRHKEWHCNNCNSDF